MKMPLVSINCITYNHEPYIRQCLDGFMMQKTNFAFEVLIHDDASTDNTANIIREYETKYPEIIKPIYQTENQYSKGGKISFRFNLPRAQGKYIAMCEGDDYWTDPYKLQKQVDFLEENEEYGMVYTDAVRYNQATQKYDKNKKSYQINNLEDILLSNKIPTLTACFKRELWQDYFRDIYPNLPDFPFGDYPMWVYFFSREKLHYLPEYTAVYRVLINSASHSSNIDSRLSFIKRSYDFRIYMLDTFFCEKKYLRYKIQEKYAFNILQHCIINKGKQQFYDNYYLIKYVKDVRLRFIYYLIHVNFILFSPIYRSLLLLRNKMKHYFKLRDY